MKKEKEKESEDTVYEKLCVSKTIGEAFLALGSSPLDWCPTNDRKIQYYEMLLLDTKTGCGSTCLTTILNTYLWIKNNMPDTDTSIIWHLVWNQCMVFLYG